MSSPLGFSSFATAIAACLWPLALLVVRMGAILLRMSMRLGSVPFRKATIDCGSFRISVSYRQRSAANRSRARKRGWNVTAVPVSGSTEEHLASAVPCSSSEPEISFGRWSTGEPIPSSSSHEGDLPATDAPRGVVVPFNPSPDGMERGRALEP